MAPPGGYVLPDQSGVAVTRGRSFPLGATHQGTGTNFAVFSEVATRVQLCLFDSDGRETQIDLPEVDGHVWHGHVDGVVAGQLYGFRVDGPSDWASGHRCNPHKLLLDPYAKAIDGEFRWNQSLYGYALGSPDTPNNDDSAPSTPKSVVVNSNFDWRGDRSPGTELADTVIYEAHVRGMTQRHPDVPERLRGTYRGFAHPAVIDHLLALGVTAVELLPVHHFADDPVLVERGLRNYWGYNSIGFFAPHRGYAAAVTPGGQVDEFKAMVYELHQAGIEVILDVAFNHTAEGNHLGPTLSMRGIDNAAYYWLDPADRRFYRDVTGTGNTLNARHFRATQLVMDSLRYWVNAMHVDGFRFNLTSAHGRETEEVDMMSSFFDLVHQDPDMSHVKLIAEPWDVGPGGYQAGRFPPRWTEWNGRYRDTVRSFWRGEPVLGDFATRLTGSADLFQNSTRRPTASVNFVTCHDGFTLRDLVSYNRKHNECNGHGNVDGEADNRSWNCGAEGPTDDVAITRRRARLQRAMIATTILSQGVPMLSHGDELGRTQAGSNNAYCQDNEMTWIDWQAADRDLLTFTRQVINLRNQHPVFRRRAFLRGHDELSWFSVTGEAMTIADWNSRTTCAVALFYNGGAITDRDHRGREIHDDSFLLLVNGGRAATEFVVPPVTDGEWRLVIDTSTAEPPSRISLAAGSRIVTEPSTLMVWQAPRSVVGSQSFAGTATAIDLPVGDTSSAA